MTARRGQSDVVFISVSSSSEEVEEDEDISEHEDDKPAVSAPRLTTTVDLNVQSHVDGQAKRQIPSSTYAVEEIRPKASPSDGNPASLKSNPAGAAQPARAYESGPMSPPHMPTTKTIVSELKGGPGIASSTRKPPPGSPSSSDEDLAVLKSRARHWTRPSSQSAVRNNADDTSGVERVNVDSGKSHDVDDRVKESRNTVEELIKRLIEEKSNNGIKPKTSVSEKDIEDDNRARPQHEHSDDRPNRPKTFRRIKDDDDEHKSHSSSSAKKVIQKKLTKRERSSSFKDFTPGTEIEVFYQITNPETKSKRKIWWPGIIEKFNSKKDAWKIKYDPQPPEFESESYGLIRFLNSRKLLDCEQDRKLFWRQPGNEVEQVGSDEDNGVTRYFNPKHLLKGGRETDDEDYDQMDTDDGNDEREDSFIVDDEEASTSAPVEPPPESFAKPLPDFDAYASHQRKQVKAGLYCSLCKSLRPFDSFSAKQKKVEKNKERFCLRHSSSSGFNKPAITSIT